MQVLRLQAQNFRLLRAVDLTLHPQLNLIIGDNAAGKTSLLETLYTAAHGRTLNGLYADACGTAAAGWWIRVSGRIQDDRPSSEVEISFQRRRHFQRINQTDCSRADLARLLPLALLNPKSHALVEEGPAQRRRFLDWGLFHVEHRFVEVWRRYRRALRQRNAVLRSGGGSDQLRPWNEELAAAGEALDEKRQQQMQAITQPLQKMLERLVGDGPWTAGLDAGWDTTGGLMEALEQSDAGDRRSGSTRCGPHRAELWLNRGDDPARRRISRGEEKLTAAAMLLVQASQISQNTGNSVMLLVDDFTSELGDQAQRRLLDELLQTQSQVVITALSTNELLVSKANSSMFHVEHGAISRVVN